MNTAWLMGAKTPEERDQVKKMVGGNNFALEALEKIILVQLEEAEKVVRSDYKNPSWSHEQAHRNGQVDAFKTILKVLQDRHPVT